MKLTVTGFRKNLYKYLDKVIETGVQIELERKGMLIRIMTDRSKSRLGNLEPHNYYKGDYGDIDKIDWLQDWKDGGAGR